jgi:hypothetical protein
LDRQTLDKLADIAASEGQTLSEFIASQRYPRVGAAYASVPQHGQVFVVLEKHPDHCMVRIPGLSLTWRVDKSEYRYFLEREILPGELARIEQERASDWWQQKHNPGNWIPIKVEVSIGPITVDWKSEL